MSTYLRQFSKLKDWVDYAKSPLSYPDTLGRASQNCQKNWNGVDSLEEAIKLFLMGVPDLSKRMMDIVEKVRGQVRIPTTVHNFAPSVDGSAPNVFAFLSGEPEDMFHLQEEEMTAPPSEILVQLELCISAYVQPEQMMWAGATVWAAAEALRNQGCSVTFLMTHTVQQSYGGDYWQSAVQIPTTIDMDTLAFLFAHPATLRAIVFSIMEHEDEETRRKFDFRGAGSYSTPSQIVNPAANIMLASRELGQRFGHDQAVNLEIAKAFCNKLVDTNFESYE